MRWGKSIHRGFFERKTSDETQLRSVPPESHSGIDLVSSEYDPRKQIWTRCRPWSPIQRW